MVCFVCSEVPAQLRRRPLHIVDFDVTEHVLHFVSILLIQPLHDEDVIATKLRDREFEILLVRQVLEDLLKLYLRIGRVESCLLRVKAFTSDLAKVSLLVDDVSRIRVLAHLQSKLLEVRAHGFSSGEKMSARARRLLDDISVLRFLDDARNSSLSRQASHFDLIYNFAGFWGFGVSTLTMPLLASGNGHAPQSLIYTLFFLTNDQRQSLSS